MHRRMCALTARSPITLMFDEVLVGLVRLSGK